ncbi:RHS repeat protein, partial [Salmonella enterica subsp. salamae]|nr:RHS repeat protein [Salmonella enterica subsp. salamae]
TDPAGNRTAARDKYPVLPESFPDNRISQDVDNVYHYDEHGRLTEKDERRIRPQGSLSHHYGYDNRHRLTHYRQMQPGSVLTESRYLYDPLGRRISKRVRKSQEERESLTGKACLWLNPTPEVTWYGWDGDRLTTTQTDDTRIQTVYPPGSFTPLIRTETATEELAKTHHRSLAEKLQQDAGMAFVPELVALLDNLERELNAGRVSEQSRQWLAQCGLTPEQMKNQMVPAYTPARKIHLYHCDHRGLPLALIDVKGRIAWRAEFDEWGNVLREDNPDNLQQLIRLPGQQYDEESGLHYNRHRYYDPGQGRYITQDPTGLAGGLNPYTYPLNPVTEVDPLGLLPQQGDDTPSPNGMRFDPDFWNDFGTRRSNNCYSYAIDRPFITTDHPLLFQTPKDLTCSGIEKNLENSGIQKTDSSGRCPDGYHKIALFIALGKDFHFYRQDSNGTWSHKRGTGEISNIDAVGNIINDPDKAVRSYKRWTPDINYSEGCGTYCAKD